MPKRPDPREIVETPTNRQRLIARTNHVTEHVDGDVYVSVDKPYTLRLNVAMMNRLAAYCETNKRGKGAIISDVLTAWLDEQEAVG